jgi:hypothetical protein
LLDVRNDLKNPELRSFLKQAKTKSNLDMDLGFSSFTFRVTKLRNKGSLVSPLSPGFC